MTKTIEIQTKTVHTAPEPPRDTRWTSPRIERCTAGETVPLQYDEDREGWTWGTKDTVFKWEDFVNKHHRSYFPLTQVPTIKHEIAKGASTHVKPVEGDEFTIASYSGCQDISFFLKNGDVLEFKPEQAAKLRDFLVETVKTTES